MKWLDLDLGRAGEVDRQVDEVITTFETLQKNRKSANAAQVNKAISLLKKAIVDRVAAMEAFYHQHDLDPRSNRIEAARLKLKRLMKEAGFDASTLAREAGGGGAPAGGASAATPRGGARGLPSPQGGPVAAAVAASKAKVPLRDDLEDEKVTLKIQMTHAEYEELRVRREAMKKLLHRGDGKMAWESAYNPQQRADPRREGMHTFGEIPFVAESNRLPERHQPQLKGQARFDTFGKVPPSDPGRLNDGQRGYVSANSEIVSASMRFDSPRDLTRGGAKAVSSQPFNAVTPRTKASNEVLKVYPLGSMK